MDVRRWYFESYRKELHAWLRMPSLELREAACLLFGRDPSRLSIDVYRPDGADWDNNLPGIDTRFTFYELARRAVFSGELEGREDSPGRILVTPSKVFEFALARGLEMKWSLDLVWLEALMRQAYAGSLKILEGKTHEQSEHPSEIQMTTKEPWENIRAEWWISTDDGSFFFRTLTNEIEDGVAEFKRDTKNREVMVLLCERGNKRLSIAEILKAAYPDDLEELQKIFKEAPRKDAGKARIEYFKNSSVLNIFKKAKQLCRTLQEKLYTNGIPSEVIEVRSGLETLIADDPSAPVVFLKVQRLRKKAGNEFKVYPRIASTSGLSEHTDNAFRPHL